MGRLGSGLYYGEFWPLDRLMIIHYVVAGWFFVVHRDYSSWISI